MPGVLVMLKDFLITSDGIPAEGIFRKSGLESEMLILKEKINAGEPFETLNSHSLATLMKRWYKELPKRLLVDVNRDLDDSQYLKLENLLKDELYVRLFYWLMDLLLKVVEKQDVNFMDPKNLAIVWGPGMVGSSQDAVLSDPMNAMDGFNDTRFGINVIEMNLTHLSRNNIKPANVLKSLGLVTTPRQKRSTSDSEFTLAARAEAVAPPVRSAVRKSGGAQNLPMGILNEMIAKRQQITKKSEPSQPSPVVASSETTTAPAVTPKPEIPAKPALPPKPTVQSPPIIPPKPTSVVANDKDTPPPRPPPRPPK